MRRSFVSRLHCHSICVDYLGDHSHTLILMVIILYFMFEAYSTNPMIGSRSAMFALLKKAASRRPAASNQDGSYVTLKSNYALVFGIIQLCSGSGTVFSDQACWQHAIASRPTTAARAYILGVSHGLQSHSDLPQLLDLLLWRLPTIPNFRPTHMKCHKPKFLPVWLLLLRPAPYWGSLRLWRS